MPIARSSTVALDPGGAGWYASPTGSATGAGTYADPWDLQTALDGGYPAGTLSTAAATGASVIVWMRGGTYEGNFTSNVSGIVGSGVNNPGGKIQFRSYTGEWAKIDMTSGPNGNNVLLVSSDYCWFRDFEVMSSYSNRTSAQTGPWPTDVNSGSGTASSTDLGIGTKLVHLVCHDTPNGAGLWADATGGEIYGCINYYSGWLAPNDTRNHGHCTYDQSETSRIHRKTINWGSADQNVVIYGSAGPVVGYNFSDNIAFSGGALGPANGVGEMAVNIWTSSSTFRDNIFTNNVTYFYGGPTYPTDAPGKYSVFGVGANCVYTNNYEANGAYDDVQFLDPDVQTNWTITGNTFAMGHVVDHDGYCGYNDNRSDLYSPAFYNGNTFQELVTPTTNYIKVYAVNDYEVGRGHVAVFNWENDATVDVDVSSFLPAGPYYVYASQNPLGGYIASGTYSGTGTISLSTAAQTVVAPVGLTAIPATGPEFNAYIIRRVATWT